MKKTSEPIICSLLGNGLKVIAARTDGNVVYTGILTNAGSRDDYPGLDGLAHFVEHTIFKGTASRRGWQISNRLESVGGELNAYTTKENIMVYSSAPTGYEDRALELIADLVQNATFPADEIDLERSVVIEEINSYHDNASYAVFDEFDEKFYQGSSLAHNILGYEDSVKNITSADARSFLERSFTPGEMVLYCMSPSDPERVIQLMNRHFSDLVRPDTTKNRSVPAITPRFDETIDRNNRQANTLLGARIFGSEDPRRYAMFLLSNILGGPAMNSRLNRELRENRGLVYTVETNVTLCKGTGMFQIYFGTDPEQVEKCSRVALHELDKLAQAPMPEKSFRQTTRQISGQLLVSGDNREGCAMSMAKSLLRHGEIISTKDTATRIAALTPEDLCEAARMVVSSPMSRLTII